MDNLITTVGVDGRSIYTPAHNQLLICAQNHRLLLLITVPHCYNLAAMQQRTPPPSTLSTVETIDV
jgi:hypothetical protein